MFLWSLRSFWVERFDLNQSLKIDIWRKSFLDQCTISARNRFFPRSRLGQMTCHKLKPHPSWDLLHAPFNYFTFVYTNWKNPEFAYKCCLFSPGCCLINTVNRSTQGEAIKSQWCAGTPQNSHELPLPSTRCRSMQHWTRWQSMARLYTKRTKHTPQNRKDELLLFNTCPNGPSCW